MNDRALYIGYPRTNCAINLIFSLFFSLSASVLVPLLKTNEFCVGNCYGCTARRRLFTFNGKVYKRKRMEKSPQLLLIGRRCETRRYYTIQCIACVYEYMDVNDDCAYVKFPNPVLGVWWFAPCFIIVFFFLFLFFTIIFSIMGFSDCC